MRIHVGLIGLGLIGLLGVGVWGDDEATTQPALLTRFAFTIKRYRLPLTCLQI